MYSATTAALVMLSLSQGVPPEQYTLTVREAVALLLSVTVKVTVRLVPTWHETVIVELLAESERQL